MKLVPKKETDQRTEYVEIEQYVQIMRRQLKAARRKNTKNRLRFLIHLLRTQLLRMSLLDWEFEQKQKRINGEEVAPRRRTRRKAK